MKYAKPKVIWLTGAPAALSAELGSALQRLCRNRSIPAMFVDEAQLGSCADGEDSCPSTRLCRLAKSLAEQGYPVIVSATPRRSSCLAWNRAHLPHYVEVHLEDCGTGPAPIAPDIRVRLGDTDQGGRHVVALAETIFEEVFGRGQLVPGLDRHRAIPSAGIAPAMHMI